jgi:Rad3-related DNA helicase
LTELLRRKNAGIFVASPSAVAGIDGKDDMIRLNIIAKLPFPSLGDPRLRYLSKVAPEVYALKVARDIVQAAGRGTRHQSDFSHTVILDGSFRYFIQRNRHLFPQWFLNALRS